MRQITVVFCDMVGSSALSTQLHPEDQRDVVASFQQCCATEIRRFDGMVAQYFGDGVLAYFGYPHAHEDDAERGVRAGLAVIAGTRLLQPAPGVTVQARVGVATGLVVVGDLAREGVTQENAAIGETTNLAARFQAIADPDCVVVGPETRHLVDAAFEFQDLGPQSLKGFDGPVRVHRVLRESEVENRFEARHQDGAAPLVGRDEELEFLLRRWERAKRGEGRCMLVTGEAGIGKSRLTRALQDALSTEPFAQIVCHCSPYHQDTAFHPVASQLAHAARIDTADDPAVRSAKARSFISSSVALSEHEISSMASLVAMRAAADGPAEPSPQQAKERTLAALTAYVRALCAEQPVLIVFEDVHWIDASSLELLTRIVDLARDAPVLIVVTARPDFAPPWPDDRHVSRLVLTRLGRSEACALVADVTGGKELPDEVLDQIIQRTDGVPLFVEELTKTVLESGLLRETEDDYELIGPLPPLSIPTTLHASLLARLDRLSSVKDVAQIGAAIGREFSYELICDVAGLAEEQLRTALEQLVRAELIFQRGAIPHAVFVFKHALVQDTAYASLLRSSRQTIHSRIAQSLEARYPALTREDPAIFAHHYAEAGLIDQAIAYSAAAGDMSVSRWANKEAVGHYGEALRLVALRPPTAERDHEELGFRLKYGQPLIETRGYASREVEAHYRATVELAQRLGDRAAEFTATRSLWNCVYDTANLDWALQLAERLVELAEETDDDVRRAPAFRALGSTLMSRADLAAADAAFQKCVSAASAMSSPAWMEAYGEVPAIVGRQYQAVIGAIRGRPGARDAADLAIADALQLGVPIARAFGYGLHIFVLLLQRDYETCLTIAQDNNEFSKARGFTFWIAHSKIIAGVCLANLGRADEGLPLAQQGLREWIASGAELHVPTWSGFISEAALASGDIDLAERLLTKALAAAGRTGEALYAAELHRVNGLFQLRLGRREEGRKALQAACALARSQGALVFELRAANDLAEDHVACGEHERAEAMLAQYRSLPGGTPTGVVWGE